MGRADVSVSSSNAVMLGRMGFAVAAAYFITVHSLAGSLATSVPETALRLNPHNPIALSVLAERAISPLLGSGSPEPQEAGGNRLQGFARLPKFAIGEREPQKDNSGGGSPNEAVQQPAEQIEHLLKRAVLANPLDAHAISLLGALAIGNNDDGKATRLMQEASSRSTRATIANYWLMRSDFQQGKYDDAVVRADMILRQRPQNISIVAPVLGRIADAAPATLLPVLAEGPLWRGEFFANLKGNIKDARTPLNFMLQLKDTAHPPTPWELGAYINLLIDHQLWDLAYNAWLQFLPPERLASAGFISNGSFDFPPSDYRYPFDWSIHSDSGVIADVVPVEGTANNALMLKFGPGRVSYSPVAQTTMLVAGTYVLNGRYKSDIKSRRGFKWQLDCLGKEKKPLAATELINGKTADWMDISVPFTVPAGDCRAQRVSLELDARSSSETIVSGTLVFDDLSITRANVPPSGPQKVLTEPMR